MLSSPRTPLCGHLSPWSNSPCRETLPPWVVTGAASETAWGAAAALCAQAACLVPPVWLHQDHSSVRNEHRAEREGALGPSSPVSPCPSPHLQSRQRRDAEHQSSARHCARLPGVFMTDTKQLQIGELSKSFYMCDTLPTELGAHAHVLPILWGPEQGS